MIMLWAFLSLYFLWIFYIAVMSLKRAKENNILSKPALCFGVPILLVGYLLDVLVNLAVLPFILLDIPRSWTVTGTLKYHIYKSESGGWREKLSSWFCSNLLNTFDPDGKHC